MKEHDSVDNEFLDSVMKAAQLATCLEVSGTPKPGNVHRTANFFDTRFEHFLAGGIALGPVVRESARMGLRAARKQIKLENIGVGSLIRTSVIEVKASHTGGNTHLGVSLLFVPLAASAGYTYAELGYLNQISLRRNVKRVIRSTTSIDAKETYDAILLASSGALGRLSSKKIPDLNDPKARTKLAESKITLLQLMKLSASWDNISREWSTGMEMCFEKGYSTLSYVHRETKDINVAVVHTFLTLLSQLPDTFIARKIGIKETQNIEEAVKLGSITSMRVAEKAGKALALGGLLTRKGTEIIESLDRELRESQEPLNPGTTADLTACSLMIALLLGLKP